MQLCGVIANSLLIAEPPKKTEAEVPEEKAEDPAVAEQRRIDDLEATMQEVQSNSLSDFINIC